MEKTGNFQKFVIVSNSHFLLVSAGYRCYWYRNCTNTGKTGQEIIKTCENIQNVPLKKCARLVFLPLHLPCVTTNCSIFQVLCNCYISQVRTVYPFLGSKNNL